MSPESDEKMDQVRYGRSLIPILAKINFWGFNAFGMLIITAMTLATVRDPFDWRNYAGIALGFYICFQGLCLLRAGRWLAARENRRKQLENSDPRS